MLDRTLVFVLVAFLLNAICLETALARTPARDDPTVEKVKKQVAKRGTGTKARVKVQLTDGSKVQGFIHQIGVESFTVIRTDKGYMGVARTIAYNDVVKLNGKGASRDTGLGPPKASTVIQTILEGFFVFCKGI